MNPAHAIVPAHASAPQSMALAAIQGVTELFPISSLGHAVLVTGVMGWSISQDSFLPLLTLMHFGTAIAMLFYFRSDWWSLGSAMVVRGPQRAEHLRLLKNVLVATVPVLVAGALLEHFLREVFARPVIAAVFLIANGALLFAGDHMQRAPTRALDELRWRGALKVGCWQCFALIPGLSRSGLTMVGGYREGLTHADAARFSFLSGTLIIFAATTFEVPSLFRHGVGASETAIAAGVVAGVAALASLALLMRWFKDEERRAFMPFALYCALAGVSALGIIAVRG